MRGVILLSDIVLRTFQHFFMFGLVRGESVSVLLTAESVFVTVNVKPQ